MQQRNVTSPFSKANLEMHPQIFNMKGVTPMRYQMRAIRQLLFIFTSSGISLLAQGLRQLQKIYRFSNLRRFELPWGPQPWV
jgi:hypothetical protein